MEVKSSKVHEETQTSQSTKPATTPKPINTAPARTPWLMAPFASPVVAVLDADAAEPDAEAEVEAVLLAAVAFAAVWNASNDLAAVGLTAKTIPAAQWLFTHRTTIEISPPMSRKEEQKE